jgi:hypothetical protein
VRVACHRSHKHRLAGVIQTSANKSFTKTYPQVIGKPMTMRAAASRTHSKPGKSILKAKLKNYPTQRRTTFLKNSPNYRPRAMPWAVVLSALQADEKAF